MADTSIGKAYVQIIPKATGFSKNVESQIGGDVAKSGESAGKSFGSKMLGAVTKLGIAAAAAKLFKDSIDAGANLQQSFGGLETIYGDAADAAKDYAYQAAKAGISANDYAEQAVSFGASLKQAFEGDTTKAVEAANTAIMDMTDNAAKMGTPIENIQNAYQGFAKQNYTMLDNLKLGYGGTKEEMQRLLSDAQELSGVEYNIDNLGDVYDAIHVIQEDLGLTGVAADEAATTFSGSFGAMKAAAENFMADLALGEDIGPSLSALADSIGNFVVGNLLPMVGNIVKQLPSIIAQLPGMIADALPDIIATAADIVSGLAQGIVDNLPIWIEGIGQLWSAVWDSLCNIDWAAAGQIVVDLLKAAWEGLKDIAQGIWDFIVGVFTGEVEFPDLGAAAKVVWSGLCDIAQEVWDGVVAIFTSVIDFLGLSDIAEAAWNGICDIAQSIWDTVCGIFGGDIEIPSPLEVAQAAWEGICDIAQTIWDTITGIFTGEIEFPDLGEMAEEAWNTLVSLAETVWEGVCNVFGAVVDFLSLDEAAEAVWSTLEGIASGIWDGIKAVFGAADVVFSSLADAASAAWDGLTGIASGIWDGIKDIFGSFDIEWPDFGELAKGALEGLKNAAKGVWDWVKGLFSGDEEDEAVKSVKGSTDEMAAAFADAELKISAVDVSSIQTANEFVKQTALGWKRIFDNMQLTLPPIATRSLATAATAIGTAIAGYKSKMNFNWNLPTLHGKLPVISVNMRTASSSDGKTTVSYPELSASSFKWFAEGGIFHDPTIIGIGDSAGPEAAVPLDMMWKQMGKEFDKHLGSGATVTNYITVNGAEDPAYYAETLAREIKQQLRMA